MKTIKQILRQHKNIKRNNEIPLIIAHSIKKEKEFIFTHDEYSLTLFEYLKFKYFLNKLKQNYPLSYLTKNKEFFNLNFFINKNVLVPRPETEIMVEKAIDIIEEINLNEKKKKILLIDVGTGSGCIPISILKNIQNNVKTIAIDISKKALVVAKQNAKNHGVEIEFRYGNLLKPVIDKNILSNYTDIIITANLPYLTEKQFEDEKSVQKEPKLALVAQKQGLELYILLLQQISEIVKKYPQLKLNILLEIDPFQDKIIHKVIQNTLYRAKIQTFKDLTNKSRTIIIRTY